MNLHSIDLGLLIVRVAVGGIVLAHGLQKIGYLGGRGFSAFASGFDTKMGFRPGWLWASVVVLTEVVGGVLVVVGLLGPIAPLAITADMIVAAYTVHAPNGFWNTKGGYEFNLALGAASLGLAFAGFGAWALDSALGLAWPDWLLPAWLLAMAVGVAAALTVRATSGGKAAA